MFRNLAVACVTAALSLGASPASARPSDQDVAFEAARSGTILPLPDIVAKVNSNTRGELLGSDYDAGSRTYRLKYMQSGSVVWIDVDARSGRIIGRRGR